MESKSKLIDHLIILGVDVESGKITVKTIQDNAIAPTILDILPPPQGENGFPRYLENFHMWGFENNFKIYDENLRVIYGKDEKFRPKANPETAAGRNGIESKNYLYSFIMTDEHSCKRYCSALLFHEPFYLKIEDKAYRKKSESDGQEDTSPKQRNQRVEKHALIYVPKSINLVSSIPCFDAQRSILKYLFGDLLQKKDKDYCNRNIRIPTRYVWNLACLIKDIQGNYGSGLDSSIDKQWEKRFDYNRSQHFNGLGKEEEVIVNETQLREFYISALFSLIDLPKKPTERVVLKLHNEDRNSELARYRTIKKAGIYLPHTSYKFLFKRLSPKNIVRVFKYFMLEKQIIFFSSHPEEIPYITEAFMNLIAPMTWCCLYVPFLPIMMWEILHAVMPYIVGVSSKFKEFVAHQIDLTDKIVVDLDDDALFIGEDSCEFPKEPQNYLLKKLEEVAAIIRKTNSKAPKEFWLNVTLNTRQWFNTGLLSIFNNYLAFFKHPKKKQGGVIKITASEVFQVKEYLAQFNKNDIHFMREFSTTMMFINLVEESYRLIYSDRNTPIDQLPENIDEISHFIEQLKAMAAFSYSDPELSRDNSTYLNLLHPRAIAQIESDNFDLISKASQQYSHPEMIDLFPYLIKYYFRYFLTQKERIKLLSSPLSFKTTNQATTVTKSPERQSNDSLTKSFQFLTPLNKARIVDLNKVFQAPPKQNTQNKDQIKKRADDSQIVTESTKLISISDIQSPLTTTNKSRNSDIMSQDRRFSMESPVLPEKISVQIDYQQLAKMNESQKSAKVSSRFSLPTKKPEATPSNPREKGKNISRFAGCNECVSHPEIGSKSDDQYIKKQTKVQGSTKSMLVADEDANKDLYNALHIPKKASDTNYRFSHGKILQGSESNEKSTRSSSGKNPIFQRKDDRSSEIKEEKGELEEAFDRAASEEDYEESIFKVDVDKKMNNEAKDNKMKIFDKRDVYISPWDEARNDGGSRKKNEGTFFDNIDMKRKSNGNYI